MVRINENYLKLPGSYLFSDIARKVARHVAEHPEQQIIRLGIGDVTRPLAPGVIAALRSAVADEAAAATFHGYGPEQGYDFLRDRIAAHYTEKRGVQLAASEIFVGDGAKSDIGNIGDIFAADSLVAVCDPVYPVYVDTNAMAGRAGEYGAKGRWSRLLYLPCTEENGFCPDLPGLQDAVPDLIYLCYPNNPTGSMVSAGQLKKWVDYANQHSSVILYDSAYEAYIVEDLPHSIYEIEGSRTCAIEFNSFSKLAGFTGIRLSYAIFPDELYAGQTRLSTLWNRRQTTKFNGASYLSQRAGEAVFSAGGQREIRETIGYYQANARLIRTSLQNLGFTVYGGINAPYIWLKTPDNLSSWQFFDLLLDKAGVVGTPGSGFGPCGEGFLRLTAFGSLENTRLAMERLAAIFKAG
jgi:LL-diaminopimelate aminotransferase